MNKLRTGGILAFTLVIGIMLVSAARPTAADAEDAGLTTKASPSGAGTVDVDPAGPYSIGQTVSITANAAPGWELDRWSVNRGGSAWWDIRWAYRVPVTVRVGAYARHDKPAEAVVDFTALLATLGESGTFRPNSVRVIEVDGDGNVVDQQVPSQFDPAADYDAAANAKGTVVWLLEGNTPANATRRYHIYFHIAAGGFGSPSFEPLVTTTEGVSWPQTGTAFPSLRLATTNATYYYHEPGGGFASLLDTDGNDWIHWSSANGKAGDYRGIPNMVPPSSGGFFHPGRTTATTTLLNEGPLKATFKSTNADTQEWETVWEVYPDYARMTVTRTPGLSYWFLYEGTPGGVLNPAVDTLTRSDGSTILASETWTTDIPNEEWMFASDPALDRSLFMAHDPDDTKVDAYVNGDDLMTVFGFGRSGLGSFLTGNARHLTIGLVDSTDFDTMEKAIYNAYKPMTVTLGDAQRSSGAALGKQNPIELVLTEQQTVTAYFRASKYTVDVSASPSGSGTVVKTPKKNNYLPGEEVTLEAVPKSGYLFAGWQGDLTGTTNPLTFNITQDITATAQFVVGYTVTGSSNPQSGGAVLISPQLDAYPAGMDITVTAAATPGYQFTGWSGGLTGTTNPQQVSVDSDLDIVGNFALIPYTFEGIASGPGSVDWTPKKASYTYGDVVRVTATPDEGAVFINWSGAISGTENPIDVVVDDDKMVTAIFRPEGAEYMIGLPFITR